MEVVKKTFSWKTKEDSLKEEAARELQVEHTEQKKLQSLALERFMQFEMEKLIKADELTDEQKADFLDVFDPFNINTPYAVGHKVRYEGVVYEVIQAHTSQADWLPQNVPALYKVYLQKSVGDDEVIHDWIQPTGAHDSYSTGDGVMFEKKVYESTVDGNVWPPGVYGWTVIEVS